MKIGQNRVLGWFWAWFWEVFWSIWEKLGLRGENLGRDLHFAPVDGPRTFSKKYVWSRYYWNFGFSIIDWFFELLMASPAKTTVLTSFGPIWSLYFRSQYFSLSRFCQLYVIVSTAVLKKNLLERRLVTFFDEDEEVIIFPVQHRTFRHWMKSVPGVKI